ncbi:unnamed protein product, partial [Mesorhabditis belari]|uniref:B box-type domain-containing protein n=1 Tax=Mesorhabditis belari TaxID=2138241 RepID=A0AAF3EB58_9BILA
MAENGESSGVHSPSPKSRDSKSSGFDSPPSVGHSIPRSNTSSPLLDTALLPLDDPTTCPYCHKNFRKPRVLDCLHSMCEDCIIAQLDGRRETFGNKNIAAVSNALEEFELETTALKERPTPPGVIRCPICSQESHVGNDVRYVHTMLMDFVRMVEADELRGFERKCRACKSEQAAVALCQHCVSDLCPTCVQAHKNMRMFDGHQVLLYEELEMAGRSKDARIVNCCLHGQPYIMLCATCETLVCKTCLENDHGATHKLVEITTRVVDAIQNELSQLAARVRNKWKESMTQWNSQSDRHAHLQSQYEMAKTKIEFTFEEVHRMLEETRARKLQELDTERDRQDDLLVSLDRKVDLTQARVADAVSFAERLVTKANGLELIASRRKILQQLTNLKHTMPALNSQFELEYGLPSKREIELHLSNACGSVSLRSVNRTQPLPDPVKSVSEETMVDAARDAWRDAPVMKATRPVSRAGLMTQNTIDLSGTKERAGPGAIGMERRKTVASSGLSTTRDYANIWPPSNPPDLPSPSPPKEFADSLKSSASNSNMLSSGMLAMNSPAASMYNSYQWNQSNVATPTQGQVTTPGGSAAAAAAMFLNASAAGNPGLFSSANSSSMNSTQLQQLQQLKAALLLQQSNVSVGGIGALNSQHNQLLMQHAATQSRLRGHPAMDPIGTLNVSGMSLDSVSSQSSQANVRPQSVESLFSNGQKSNGNHQFPASELKMHSVFGAGVAGNSIRELNTPGGFCLADNDDILIADTNNHRIIVCGPPVPWFFGKPGQEDGCLCYPRKVVALKLPEGMRYAVLDKSIDTKSRCQIFNTAGEFVRRVDLTQIGKVGLDVQAACGTLAGHLVLVDHGGLVYSLDISAAIPRVIHWFDTAPRMGEATDVAMFDKNVYITDFRNHCVHIFSTEGTYIRRLGEPAITPYPIGIDVSKNGDVLVADTHGNHMHIVVFPAEDVTGKHPQSFTHQEFKMSRCTQLRVAASGHIVCLSKQAHTLFVFKPLFVR